LGDPALSDASAFQLLADLLGPLFKEPPHVLSLLHNQLSRAGARRLLRFQQHVNEHYDAGGTSSSNGVGSGGGERKRLPAPAAVRRSGRSSSESASVASGLFDVRGRAPLRSLCGLSPEAIRANWPAPLGDDDGDDGYDGGDDDDGGSSPPPAPKDATFGSPSSAQRASAMQRIGEDADDVDSAADGDWCTGDGAAVHLTQFQAVHQPELRPTSFLLLLSELAAPPHVHTLTALDLSSNSNLALGIDRFGSLGNLKRLACALCPSVGGCLQPLARRCPGLTHLRLRGTCVGGTLDGVGSLLPKLRVLDLRHTRVEGNVGGVAPGGATSKLRWLGLAGLRRLEGAVLPALSLPLLRHLDLGGTAVHGTLVGAGDHWPSLKHLSVEHCKKLRGSIAPLAGCRKLVDLNLSLTQLSGGCTLVVLFPAACLDLKRVHALNCPAFLHNDDGEAEAALPDARDDGIVCRGSAQLSPAPEEAARRPSLSQMLSPSLLSPLLSPSSGRWGPSSPQFRAGDTPDSTGAHSRLTQKEFDQMLSRLKNVDVAYTD
jgi:hypothetical protein